MLGFARVLRIFKTALFAVAFAFVSTSLYAYTCPSGYHVQQDLVDIDYFNYYKFPSFGSQMKFNSLDGTNHGSKYFDSTLEKGSWWVLSHISLKGQAYCSDTDGNGSHSYADNIVINDNGQHCWCQIKSIAPLATKMSDPHIDVYAKYVHFADQDDFAQNTTDTQAGCTWWCPRLCASYLYDLRSVYEVPEFTHTMYDSIPVCAPDETNYTINYNLTNGAYWPSSTPPATYTSNDNDITVPQPLREGYSFKGWCVNETDNCTDIQLQTSYVIATGTTGNINMWPHWIRISCPNDETLSNGECVAKSQSSSGGTQSCGIGYETQTSSLAVLNPVTNANLSAFRSHNGEFDVIRDELPKIQAKKSSNGKWGATFSYGIMYGEASCNVNSGQTPPEAMLHSVLQTVPSSTAGGNCWCRMTEFTRNGQSAVETTLASAPWVYVQTFVEEDGQTATNNCYDNCAETCVNKIFNAGQKSNQFFRSQLFGNYSTCKVAEYDIDYELNDGEWDSDDIESLPTKYTIAYKDVVIPSGLIKNHYNFSEWCENSGLSVDCGNPKIIQTGSYGDKTMYAKWVPDTFNIVFEPGNANGKTNFTGTMDNQLVYYHDVNIPLNSNTFSIEGYRFKEWECSALMEGEETPTEITYGDGDIIVMYSYVSDMTCTAQWEPIDYYIDYYSIVDFDSEWLVTRPTTFTIEDDVITIPDPIAADVQYQFTGWCQGEENDCETLETNYTIQSGTVGNITLWAHWDAAEYPVTYYYDENSYNENVTLTEEQATELTLPLKYVYSTETILPEITREHYTFLGWYDVNDLDGEAITVISDSETGAKSFVAKWEPIVYTITYFKDSTSYTEENVWERDTYTVEDDDITELREPEPIAQFRFDGWRNVETDELVEEIIASNGGDINLYPTWTRVACDDGYYLSEQDCLTCPEEFPDSDGTTAQSINSCYAKCQLSELTSKCSFAAEDSCQYYDYANNEYLYDPCADSGRVGLGLIQDINTCNKDWVTNMYNEESEQACEVKISQCQEHYNSVASDGKSCTPDTYNIEYHENIEGLAEEYYTYSYGQGLILPTTIPDQFYTLVGWYDNDEFEGNPITEISATDFGNKRFWAKTEPKKYDVYYHQGTHGTVDNNPVKYTDALTYNKEYKTKKFSDTGIITNTGYTFCGWSRNPNDVCNSETIIEEFSMIPLWQEGNDLILYAIYSPNQHTLYYDCSGTGEQKESTTVYFDDVYTLDESMCNPIENYSIASWDCDNGLDTTIPTWNIDNDSLCIAQWVEKEYNIVYKDSDGTVITGVYNLSPTVYTASAGAQMVPTEKPINEHADFIGWCDNEDLTGDCPEFIEIPIGTNTDPITLYAKWYMHACPAGKYLDSGICYQCPDGYTSEMWGTKGKNGCYFDWNCTNACPDNATCTLVSGASNGRIYYDSGDTYSCEIKISCNDGYTLSSDETVCNLDTYHITYIDGNNELTNLDGTRTFTVVDSVQLPYVSKTGYIFDGWCVNSQNCNSENMLNGTQSAGWIGNKTLYAQWTEDEFICDSGRFLHVGDDTICLSAKKIGSPAMAVGKGKQKHYLQMTKQTRGSEGLKMNKNSTKQLNVLYNGDVYNIHDSSVTAE